MQSSVQHRCLVWSALLGLTACGGAPDPAKAGAFATAYDEYTTRAHVAEVLAKTVDAKIAISEFLLSEGKPPESLAAVQVSEQLPYGGRLSFVDGLLHIEFDATQAPVGLRGASIGIGLSQDGAWYCGLASGAQVRWVGAHPAGITSLPPKLLPSSCR
jgi:hypothetical protein